MANAIKKGNTTANLHAAKVNKNDEFYTQRADIEKELNNYNHLSPYNHFKNRIVYCNCDDPAESHFFRYFADNFSAIGLKKLICTHYENDHKKKSYVLTITKGNDKNKDGKMGRADVEQTNFLFSNGDFRSDECLELLKEADIVVTNPPFSLFREYVAQLVEYEKKFLIIGNKNATTYKEIFPLIKANKIWLGASIHSGGLDFRVPKEWEVISKYSKYDAEGNRYINMPGVRWFTNLDYPRRHEDFIPKNYKTYNDNKNDYPKYDNYDAIEVGKTADIPIDYTMVMGVPISFFDKYSPEQFEILGMGEDNGKGQSGGLWQGGKLNCLVNKKAMFKRVFIRRIQKEIK